MGRRNLRIKVHCRIGRVGRGVSCIRRTWDRGVDFFGRFRVRLCWGGSRLGHRKSLTDIPGGILVPMGIMATRYGGGERYIRYCSPSPVALPPTVVHHDRPTHPPQDPSLRRHHLLHLLCYFPPPRSHPPVPSCGLRKWPPYEILRLGTHDQLPHRPPLPSLHPLLRPLRRPTLRPAPRGPSHQ